MPRYFEEFELGEVLFSTGRTITEADVVNFAALTGDWNELHVNEEFARKGPFGQRIAHGALIFSISIGLLLSDISRRPHVIAFCSVERLRFPKPVFLGDTISAKLTVRSLDPVNKNSGFLEAAQQVFNQNEAVVLTCTTKLLVRRRIPNQ